MGAFRNNILRVSKVGKEGDIELVHWNDLQSGPVLIKEAELFYPHINQSLDSCYSQVLGMREIPREGLI